jgi:lipoprotein NlpD
MALTLGACSSTKVRGPAPVVTRDVKPSLPTVPDGAYRVQPGDTLASIAARYGTDWRTLARINRLSDPDKLEIDQIIRLSEAPVAAAPATPGAQSAVGSEASGVVVKPVSEGASMQASNDAPRVAVVEPETAPVPAAGIALIWPAEGAIVSRFDGNNNKGVGIGGKLGAPVMAAADGRVVYSGAGLRGYGNLVILKHDDTYLTAYAHNQALLVKEDQVVKRGQRIAEMGSTESDRVKLHFEVRKDGTPVDPMKLLPAR